MTLSICIATIPERAEPLARLLRTIGTHPDVEILIDDRLRGSVSVGAKRQSLIEQATGAYVVHLDDDDHVPADYVDAIIAATTTNPDAIGHYELVEGMGKAPQLSMWSNKAPGWIDGPRARAFGVNYVRTPFHKTPIRREHSIAIGFKDMHFAEDKDFSDRLKASKRIKTEVFIPRVLYIYRYTHEDHNTKYGIK